MSGGVKQLSHVVKVRMLYKTCLRLHRALPTDLRAMGDAYLKDEFKRHKTADKVYADIFMEQWAKYAVTLSQQIGVRKPRGDSELGQDIVTDDVLETFTEDQAVQLYELYKAINDQKEDSPS